MASLNSWAYQFSLCGYLRRLSRQWAELTYVSAHYGPSVVRLDWSELSESSFDALQQVLAPNQLFQLEVRGRSWQLVDWIAVSEDCVPANVGYYKKMLRTAT